MQFIPSKLEIRLILLLIFFMNLEEILSILLGLDTIFKPFRLLQFVLLYFLFKRLRFISDLTPLIRVYVLFIICGILSFILWAGNHAYSTYLLFNSIFLVSISFTTLLYLAKVHISKELLKKLTHTYFLSLIINLGFILVFQVSSRNSGLFDNPNTMGLSAVIGVIIAIKTYKEGLMGKTNLIIYAIIAFTLVNASVSRTAFVLFVLVLLINFLRNYKLLIVLVPLMVIGLLIIDTEDLTNFDHINAIERQQSKLDREKKEIRLALSLAALDAVPTTKGIGLGIGQFQLIENFYPLMQNHDKELASDRLLKGKGLVSHNTFLQSLAENGIIGLILFTAFLYHAQKRIRLRNQNWLKNSGANIYFILLMFALSHVIFLNPLFWITMGLALNRAMSS